MALAARAQGLAYLAITDHSQRLAMAHGLDSDRLLHQIGEIDRLNELLSGITLLKGIEVDILYCRMARDQGILVSIDSDSHNEQGFVNLRWGVLQARRGWLERPQVLNTRPLPALRKLLRATMGGKARGAARDARCDLPWFPAHPNPTLIPGTRRPILYATDRIGYPLVVVAPCTAARRRPTPWAVVQGRRQPPTHPTKLGRSTMPQIHVNGQRHEVTMAPDTPLLWVLRDGLQLTGTKFGCGIALCGACVVLVDGKPVRSCVTPLSSVAGKAITTIEGLSPDRSHAVQRAWIAAEVPQCGYCQSGQILTAAALLERNSKPTEAEIEQAMSEVLCRCGTYPRIRRAMKRAVALTAGSGGED
jgi:isoquinoline 1-oxidoreductase alpha subunit